MTPRRLLSLFGLLLAAALLPAGDRAEPTLRVILIDGQNNHDWRATTPLLKRHLESCKRFTVDVASHLEPGKKPGSVKTVPFPPS